MGKIRETKYLLSIIIPVYNAEPYLKRCYESVAKKDFNDIEVVLIDDGSTDGSGMLCDLLKEETSVHTTVIHKKNGGLSSARNAGIDIAKGEYFFFLDSDDYMVDVFLDRVIELLRKREYDIIEFGSCLEKKPGSAIPKINEHETKLSSDQCIRNIITNKVGNEICFKIYRATLFHEIRFPLNRNYEDIAVCYKLLIRANNILRISSEYYIYNAYNIGSITQKNDLKNLGDMYDSVNELCDGVGDFCINNGIDPSYIEYYRKHSYIYICLKLYNSEYRKSDLMKDICFYLKKNNKYNLFKYRHYDLKRWLVFEGLLLLNKI